MGRRKIREQDMVLAQSDRHQDDELEGKWEADNLHQHCMRQVHDMGLRVVTKRSGFGKWSRLNTTFYREIRVGVGYDRRNNQQKAALLCHELVHARQWRRYGRVRFAVRYVTRPRFRWAVEVQAYSESLRAWAALGMRRKGLLEAAHGYATKLPKLYALCGWFGLRKAHVVGVASTIFRETIAEVLDD